MINLLKKTIYRVYTLYSDYFPIERGKYRLSKVLHKIFGNAIYEVAGYKILVSPVDMRGKIIIRGDIHDQIVFDTIINSLKDDDFFLDIGANIGYFSLLAASNPRVFVWAFEPSPREYQKLLTNINLNHFRNIAVYPCALGDEDGYTNMNISRDWNTGLNSMVETYSIDLVERVEVRIMPIKLLITPEISKRIKVCKIDVEGYEYFVLKGFGDLLCRMRQCIFIVEVNVLFLEQANIGVDKLYSLFENAGFRPRLNYLKNAYNEIFQYDEKLSK